MENVRPWFIVLPNTTFTHGQFAIIYFPLSSVIDLRISLGFLFLIIRIYILLIL